MWRSAASRSARRPLRNRQRLTIPEYEALRRGDADQDQRPAPIPPTANPDGEPSDRPRYWGIDASERRVYSWT